ncbi:MAG: hypothetical protein JWL75_343 [Parcubacteria group bacterium]|nr:hypothetical protein [Parcubacteria group bacterium]
MGLPKNHEVRITGPGSFKRGMNAFLADRKGVEIIGYYAAPLKDADQKTPESSLSRFWDFIVGVLRILMMAR